MEGSEVGPTEITLETVLKLTTGFVTGLLLESTKLYVIGAVGVTVKSLMVAVVAVRKPMV